MQSALKDHISVMLLGWLSMVVEKVCTSYVLTLIMLCWSLMPPI
jgi:hypothetical protein